MTTKIYIANEHTVEGRDDNTNDILVQIVDPLMKVPHGYPDVILQPGEAEHFDVHNGQGLFITEIPSPVRESEELESENNFGYEEVEEDFEEDEDGSETD